jgi:integrase/recombinase XerD
MDIHNYKKRLLKTVENIEKSVKLSDENKEIILEFQNACFSEGLSVCKIERYLYDLQRLALMLDKNLRKADKKDLMKVVVKIEQKEWSPHSKHTFKVMMKKFYRWAEGIDEKGVYPEKIRWIKTGVKNSQQKLPEELLTGEDIEKMIKASPDLRDKALISVLYESGCRIGEIGSLKIKDVHFDEYGAKINVFGKTGARRVRLVNSVPYLQSWINNHEKNQDVSAYLWINRNNGGSLTYTRMCAIIKRIGKKAGLKKRIYPHLFRHSKATFLAKHLTEAQMKDYLGWTQGSKMAGVYVHLSGRDTDDAILGLNGVKIEKVEVEPKTNLKVCIRCQTNNEATNKFCKLCGFVLDKVEQEEIIKKDAERDDMNDLMSGLLKDRDVLDLLAKKIEERKLKQSSLSTAP